MKQFKKRTVALVLASVVTVVGAFGAENYKNSLMSLEFDGNSSGAVNLTLQTKYNYSGTINAVKKDANTYVIMLPETNSQMASSPQIAGDVESVDVKTMPYTTNSKGYTKITIKTASNTLLTTKSVVYIPTQTTSTNTQTSTPRVAKNTTERPANYNYNSTSTSNYSPNSSQHIQNNTYPSNRVSQTEPVDIRKSVQQFEQPSASNEKNQTDIDLKTEQKDAIKEPIANQSMSDSTSNSAYESLLIAFSVLLVMILVVFFYIKGKNKMAEIIGEHENFNINDEPKKKEKDKKHQKIRRTINHLDKMYSNPSSISPVSMDIHPIEQTITSDTEEEEDTVIVDLDELFQEKFSQNSEETKETQEEIIEENDALDEFLSAYSFDIDEEVEAEKIFDENLYDQFINNDELKFSQEDIKRINQLLNSEISDDTINNLEKFVPKTPIVEKKPTHAEILENFVTSYTINQNITFTDEDINALYKIISVEIDNNFITDLRTNPKRMKEMQREIEKRKEYVSKPSELLTLNVKDMLPDLSEALKQQGGKKIQSNYKPQTVYFSEGYEVNTLEVDDRLPDLTIEINNKDAYVPRPSDEIQYVETGYDVDKMELDNEFIDLSNMFEHPEKYDKPKEVVVDEEALLKNISNVTFKPFYDGKEEIEILNDFDDVFSEQNVEEETAADNNITDETVLPVETAPVESTNEEETVNEYKPLPKIERQAVKIARTLKATRKDENAERLLKIIETQKEKRAQEELKTTTLKAKEPAFAHTKTPDENLTNTSALKTCYIDGEMFDIVSQVKFTEQIGCYLAKSENGYTVLSYIDNKLEKIKHYDTLKTESMQARVSEKVDDKISRYIVRIGTHKFILNVSDSNLEYIMDLC